MKTENYVNQLLHILFSQKRPIAYILLFMSTVALLVYLFSPKQYEVKGSILLRAKAIQSTPETIVQEKIRITPLEKEDLYSELQLLQSKELIAQVLKKYAVNTVEYENDNLRSWAAVLPNMIAGILQLIRAEDQIGRTFKQYSGNNVELEEDNLQRAETVLSNMTARVLPGTNVIHLKLTGRVFHQNIQLLDILMKEYIQYRQVIYQPAGTLNFLDAQTRKIRQQIQDHEQKLISLMEKGNSADPIRELETNLIVMRDINTELRKLNSRVIDLRANGRQLAESLEANRLNKRFTSLNPEFRAQFDQITELNKERNKMLRTYHPGSQVVRILDTELANTKKVLINQLKEHKAYLKVAIGIDLEKIKQLRNKLTTLTEKNIALRRQQLLAERIYREKDVLQESYQTFSRRYEEARIKTAESTNELSSFVSILDRAHRSSSPIFPSPIILPIGMISGLLLGISLGFLRELFDHTVKRTIDVQRVSSIPVVFSLPEFNPTEILSSPLQKKTSLLYRLLKRCIEATVASILLILTLPLLVILVLVVLISDGRPILYKGTRLGKDKKPFYMYKFRTLVRDAESQIGQNILSTRMADDMQLEHITGRFLRDTRLDELPQLVNVLLGNMSLVGPRPIRPQIYKKYSYRIKDLDLRFLVKPGLVGPSQIFTPHSVSHRVRSYLDNRFALQQSALLADLGFFFYILYRLLANITKGIPKIFHYNGKKDRRQAQRHSLQKAYAQILCSDSKVSSIPSSLMDDDMKEQLEIIDISDENLLIRTKLPVDRTRLNLRLAKLSKQGGGIEKQRIAYVSGEVRRELIRRDGQGYFYNVVKYIPISSLNHYKIQQHFLKGSIV